MRQFNNVQNCTRDMINIVQSQPFDIIYFAMIAEVDIFSFGLEKLDEIIQCCTISLTNSGHLKSRDQSRLTMSIRVCVRANKYQETIKSCVKLTYHFRDSRDSKMELIFLSELNSRLLCASHQFVTRFLALLFSLLFVIWRNVYDLLCHFYLFSQRQNFSWIQQKTKTFPIDPYCKNSSLYITLPKKSYFNNATLSFGQRHVYI